MQILYIIQYHPLVVSSVMLSVLQSRTSGEELLNRVLEEVGVRAEGDYFGLVSTDSGFTVRLHRPLILDLAIVTYFVNISCSQKWIIGNKPLKKQLTG